MYIGANIKKIREFKDITREYIAAELDMSVSGYSRVERGEVDLTFSKLQRIAEVLKTDVIQIFALNTAHSLDIPAGTASSNPDTDYREKYIRLLEAEVERLRKQLGQF